MVLRQLNIGGITITIRSEEHSYLIPGPDFAYSEFESDDVSVAGPADIHVASTFQRSDIHLGQ